MSPLLLAFTLNIFTQDKPPIDSASLGHWARLTQTPGISATGDYLWYTIEEQPRDGRTSILRQTHGNWKREFIGHARCYFSGDGRKAVIQQGDSLHIIGLGETQQQSIRIRSVLWPSAGAGRWLAYQEQHTGHLILTDLFNGDEQELGIASGYGFDRSGTRLLVESGKGNDVPISETLTMLELGIGQRKEIWTGATGQRIIDSRFSDDGRQLTFLVSDSGGSDLWIYQKGMMQAEVKLAAGDPRLGPELSIGGPLLFSPNGRWIFFSLELRALPAPSTARGAEIPDIWRWDDRRLLPARLSKPSEGPTAFLAVTAANGQGFLRVEDPGEQIVTPPGMVTGEHIVIRTADGRYWVASLTDGSRRQMPMREGAPTELSFSPDGKWLVYYNSHAEHYFSYELSTGIARNLTRTLPHGVSNEDRRGVNAQAVAEPAGWLANGQAILFYDKYDVWAVDPSTSKHPVCMTKGYGFAHHIKLRLIETRPVFSPGDTLLFTGFDPDNEYNGFFRSIAGEKTAPKCLGWGAYNFYKCESQQPNHNSFDYGMRPLKAATANVWVIRRGSAREAPNYFLTTDLHHFEQLTFLAPQAGYNWLTTELVRYRNLDGTTGKGILYKPENFDPTKRYPLIVNVYEQFSHRLYEFPPPEPARDNIDIPWMVSRGYLVFTPDIRYRPATLSGKTIGQWAYNSVVAAVRYLKTFPFIDGKRFGIQGHSLGAEATSYLITHTDLFAAAAEMAGPTDAVSDYLSLLPTIDDPLETQESQYIWESGQARIGATLWQRPDLYLRESAVLHADRIHTPLLLVHNKPDAAVPWRQSIELYLALRRLRKPVWLLQYEGENHSFLSESGALDYTFRLTGFFDYYLKNKPLPAWMAPRN
jgi:dipeptidyl aminopeptidase/acylaminoacyl peptidase